MFEIKTYDTDDEYVHSLSFFSDHFSFVILFISFLFLTRMLTKFIQILFIKYNENDLVSSKGNFSESYKIKTVKKQPTFLGKLPKSNTKQIV